MIRYMQEGTIYEVEPVDLAKWYIGWIKGEKEWDDRPGKEVDITIHFDQNLSDYDDWEYFLEDLASYTESQEEEDEILELIKNEVENFNK